MTPCVAHKRRVPWLQGGWSRGCSSVTRDNLFEIWIPTPVLKNLELLDTGPGTCTFKTTHGNFYVLLYFLTLVWGMEHNSRPLGEKVVQKASGSRAWHDKKEKINQPESCTASQNLIPFTSHLLCAQHSLRHFTYIPSFYAHNITVWMRLQSWGRRSRQWWRWDLNPVAVSFFYSVWYPSASLVAQW